MDHCYNGCDDPAPYRSKHNEHYDCDFAQDFEFCDIHAVLTEDQLDQNTNVKRGNARDGLRVSQSEGGSVFVASINVIWVGVSGD
jgi:hypothetical protein